MVTIKQVSDFLDLVAPLRLAEEWDNVGLLVGDSEAPAQRIMTCLTITPDSTSEAIEKKADLIVSHHPLPFHSIKRLTTDTPPTRMLWQLIRAGVSVYSPHTGFDSAPQGINQSLAAAIGLTDIRPLISIPDDPQQLGAGRVGSFATITLSELLDNIKQQFSIPSIQYVGRLDTGCHRIGIGCGSGGSFLAAAEKEGCDTFITGEASFHTCLEAQAKKISLILMGHYASERFAVEQLAAELQTEFPKLTIWPSQLETDPIGFF